MFNNVGLERRSRTCARRALDAPFLQARNQVEWARLLGANGSDSDRRRAEALLTTAESIARMYGCAGIECRARELAASTQ